MQNNESLEVDTAWGGGFLASTSEQYAQAPQGSVLCERGRIKSNG